MEEIFVHEFFNTVSTVTLPTGDDVTVVDNNIALLKVARPVDIDYYTTAKLPTPDTDYIGKLAALYKAGKNQVPIG